MPFIYFRKSRKPIETEIGDNLRMALLDKGVPVASSCSGEAVCGKCWVQVIKGELNLSEIQPEEQKLLNQFNLGEDKRISCQVKLLGDVEIDTPYW